MDVIVADIETDRYLFPNYGVVRHTLATEIDVLSDLLRELRDDDVFYDVGACLGTYTFPAATAGAEVVAFEPRPDLREILVEFAGKNDVEIELCEYALFDETRPTKMLKTDVIGTTRIGDDGETFEAQMVKCDDLVGEYLPMPDVVKIDVEGAEVNVMRGMRGTLSQCRLVYVEVHFDENSNTSSPHEFGHDPDEVIEMLDDLGFETEILLERQSNYHVKASR